MTIGQMLSISEARTVNHRFCELTGLSPQRVLVSFYGYPTLPIPPAGNSDGAGRLPEGVSREWMGHPVFWLDPRTRQRLPGEHLQAYGVRLWMELLVRGYWNDPESDTGWIDVLQLAGWDRDDAQAQERLDAYAAGAEYDEYLNALQLAESPTPLEPHWVEVRSHTLYARYEMLWLQQQALQDEQVGLSIEAARHCFQDLDPQEALVPFQEALERLQRLNPGWESWQCLQQGVNQSLDIIKLWSSYELVLALCCARSDTEHNQTRLVSEAQIAQRQAQIEHWLEQWRQSGDYTETVPNIHQALAGWAADVVTRGTAKMGDPACTEWVVRRARHRQEFIDRLQLELTGAPDGI